MARLGIWILNAVLFVLCCFLVAGLANAMIGQWIGPEPVAEAGPAAAPAPVKRSWSDRQVILDKNLFNVSTMLPDVAPVEVIAEDEPLEATRLPLKLLGTVASSNSESARAAVEDQQNRREVVVGVGDKLLDKATVEAIQRRRIVLLHNGIHEELALDEDEVAVPAKTRSTPPRREATRARRRSVRPAQEKKAQAAQERVRKIGEDSFAVDREGVENAMRNTAEIFSQARILPKYVEGEMVGVQLSAIQEGSLFQEMGIHDGDVITEVNGIVVSSPQDNAALLRELGEADEFSVSVTREDGSTSTLNYVVGEE